MKESIYGVKYRPEFIETFNDEQTTRRNCGNINNISFDDGKAYFPNSDSKITNKKDINYDGFYVRCIGEFFSGDNVIKKILDTENSLGRGVIFQHDDRDITGNISAALFTSSGLLNVGSPFVEGTDEVVLSLKDGVFSIYANGNFLNSVAVVGTVVKPLENTISIGNRKDSVAQPFIYGMDFLEIGDRGISAEEVKNMYSKRTYKNISQEDFLLLVDPSRGSILEKYGNGITNIDVLIKKIGNFYAMGFNQTTSRLDFDDNLPIISGNQPCVFFGWINPIENVNITNPIFGGNNPGSNRILRVGNGVSPFASFILNNFTTNDRAEGGLCRYNERNFVLGMYDGTNLSVWNDIDGVMTKGAEVTPTGSYSADDILSIGAYGTSRFNEGKIGISGIVKGSFTPEKIQQLYTSTKFYYQ